ncbi:MAG TPA: nitroreductase family deazaflavin-dependent oxidoreductase [Ktedonobacteraceae bacterium]|nr:nitroreductase family deazaflavin-dependent oxidoreductase [Ktedonobacteraceae bacterium]
MAKSVRRSTRALRRAFMRLHIALYRLSGGALGSRFASRSFLLLTTIGRKSGRERVTPIFYIPDAGRFILIASNWGAASDPIWWLNLQAHPQAKVRIGRNHLAVVAQLADGEERARLWLSVTSRYIEFARYQQRVTREIPVVILTPVR